MELVYSEILKTAPAILGNPIYDAIIEAAKILFPRCCRVDKKFWELEIKDRVNLTLTFSGNETKIWASSYILPDGEKEKFAYPLMKANHMFRFFSAETVIEYLEIKAKERDFIEANEG